MVKVSNTAAAIPATSPHQRQGGTGGSAVAVEFESMGFTVCNSEADCPSGADCFAKDGRDATPGPAGCASASSVARLQRGLHGLHLGPRKACLAPAAARALMASMGNP